MRAERVRWRGCAAIVVAAAVGLAAPGCDGEVARDDGSAGTAGQSGSPSHERTPASRRPARTAADALPYLVVANTAGGRVALPKLAPRDRPLLVWFWAPH